MGNKIDIFKGSVSFGVVDHVTETVVDVDFDGEVSYRGGYDVPDPVGIEYRIWKDVADPIYSEDWPVVTPAQVAETLLDNGLDPDKVDRIYNLLVQLEEQE